MKTIVEKCSEVLQNNGVILYPTDTIWGLGCDATNISTIQRIYGIKNRSFDKKCIVFMQNVEMLYQYTGVYIEEKLLEKFEKPTTLVVEAKSDRLKHCLSDENTIAFRIPNNEFCQALLKAFNKPIISTSANISNDPNPVYFEDINSSIVDQVDYTIPEEYDTGIKSQSTILKITDSVEMKFEKLR